MPTRRPLILLVPLTLVLLLIIAAVATAAPATPASPAAEGTSATPRWEWPLQPPPPDPAAGLTRGFERPPAPWAAGHRGVDLPAAPGTAVHTAGAGRITFAGIVVDRPLVVVEHAGGLRTSYEPVRPQVEVGDAVAAGERIGSLASGGHCEGCLHWGVRNAAGTYLDPLHLFGTRVQIRLYPLGR
ncbi:M23 family metallopeptidase [Ruania suaedae]|uniref:M23 family metallopeptidase n=1 Tax=Ruania suaedae TaxID=2897774 RepID=UPI001E323393|nr:M23 family metallopeptidase [Ruania suaedae]UFU04159.1 M23 family metallopeptidase [Ruania suaedae]